MKQLTVFPHRHRVNAVRLSHIEGHTLTVELELCACTAWRPVGTRGWHGSVFRRRHPAARLVVAR